MANQTVQYKGNLASANTNRLKSPNIWGDCPWEAIKEGSINGIAFFDDFDMFPLIGTQTTQIAHGQYKVFATTGGSVAPVSSVNSVERAGSILDFTADTDNDSASLAQSYPSVLLSGLNSNSGKLWFEARVALSTLLTNTNGFFLGLAEVEQWTLATGVPFNGGDAITNAAAAIGFRKGEDALGVVDTVYSDRATSFTNIGDDATTISAANTFVKLGLAYDPDNVSRCVRFFADNVELTDALSKSTLTGLTNLDANSLGLIFAHIVDSAGTAAHSYLDWWSVAQVLPG